VVARFEAGITNVTLHFISGLIQGYDVSQVRPVVPIYLLTPNVISDPLDFVVRREEHNPEEIRPFLDNFRARASRYGLETFGVNTI
jgi:hypothetical protein